MRRAGWPPHPEQLEVSFAPLRHIVQLAQRACSCRAKLGVPEPKQSAHKRSQRGQAGRHTCAAACTAVLLALALYLTRLHLYQRKQHAWQHPAWGAIERAWPMHMGGR